MQRRLIIADVHRVQARGCPGSGRERGQAVHSLVAQLSEELFKFSNEWRKGGPVADPSALVRRRRSADDAECVKVVSSHLLIALAGLVVALSVFNG